MAVDAARGAWPQLALLDGWVRRCSVCSENTLFPARGGGVGFSFLGLETNLLGHSEVGTSTPGITRFNSGIPRGRSGLAHAPEGG